MADDSTQVTDEVTAELNPTGPGPDPGPQADPIPARPADGAPKDTWITYVVALGADRAHVTGQTEHFDGEGYAAAEGLTRPELIALADRLGG